MRFAAKSLLFLTALATTFAYAQTIQPGTFKHIIIVVQENRTPDNIFGSGPSGTMCGTEDPFEPGVDIENGGYVYIPVTMGDPYDKLICNISLPMNNGSTFDPGHFYEDWTADYRFGNMDGFCHEYTPPSNCPSYSYVQRSDVTPYFQIASTYGFANYMFQTNEGPSFPAHQFLFAGTSAPVAPHDASGYGIDFVADNLLLYDSGCAYNGSQWPTWVQADGSTKQPPPLDTECFTHDSLVTDAADCTSNNCNRGTLTWRYYSPTPDGIIWDAPEGIPEVCYEQNSRTMQGNACGGTEWTSHMTFYNSFGGAPIFSDIASCQLRQITWVIPDTAWSDHPQFDASVSPPLGPSWVGDIINAIGNSYADSNQHCDYWGTKSATPEPTAVFVVWDDWGGFFDHVSPYKVYRGPDPTHCPDADAPNGWGCGYAYGFRVPFLAASEYTGTLSNGQYSSYISGPCGATGQPACPNTTQIYQHDFGSILAFTEYNFNLPFIDGPDKGYADYNALDAANGNIPLSDFFPLWTGPGSAGRPFVPITTYYPPGTFRNYYTTQQNGTYPTPTGPDEY